MKGIRTGIFIVVMALLITMSMLISGAAQLFAAEPKPRYGGTLRLSDVSDGASIGYPPKMSVVYAQRQAAPAIETLFRTDKTGKPIPWLATGVKNDVAAKAITLTLRKGVKFHDGTDFNAEAVKWNLEQYMSAKSGGTEKFRSIDIIDDYTVRINLTDWDNTITGNFAYMTGMIISPTAYKKNGEAWCVKNPIGTGPFQFVSWERDARTIYKKFPDYWQKGKPYLDGVVWTPIPDQLTRQFSLRKGEIDLAVTIAAKDLAGLEKDSYIVFRRRVGSGAYSLVPDSANSKSSWADLRVRQAAQYAIDTEAIVKTIFYGEAEPANQWTHKEHWAYNPSVVGYPYNPAKGKQLLIEAGYPNGFKTKLLFAATRPEAELVWVAVQGYLKAVGIDVELDPVTTVKWSTIATQGAKWEGLAMAGNVPNPDVAGVLAIRFHGGMSFGQTIVPEDYVRATQNAVTAPDFESKQKYAQEAMKLMIDKYCLLIMVYCMSDTAVSTSYLHNHGFMDTPNTAWWTPEEAWLER